MDSDVSSSSKNSSDFKILLSILWIGSIIVAVSLGFMYGRSKPVQVAQEEKKNVLGSTSENQAEPTSTMNTSALIAPSSVPTGTTTSFCKKAGFAQKWEYLTPYTVKQNDTYQDIATKELKDPTRVNEITQINGIGQVVVGSTLYLPPSEVTKSSGNLKEVFGKLVEKNSTSWHVSFSSDSSGQGILLPSFWFEGVPNSTSFSIGDCVKVFFDDGYKIYSISLQS